MRSSKVLAAIELDDRSHLSVDTKKRDIFVNEVLNEAGVALLRNPRWLSVEQVRKMQRCRRELVLMAMDAGELPFERRGRIRYARLTDVIAWEEQRLRQDRDPLAGLVHPDLSDFA